MRFTYFLFLIILLPFATVCRGQVTQEKIAEYLRSTKLVEEKEVGAVILYESNRNELSVENKQYAATRKVYKLIKVLKEEAFKLADVSIVFPRRMYNSQVYNVKACTYNLEGGTVQKTVLPDSDFYQNKLTRDFYQVSFTMPRVKVGSIIEYSYNIVSPLSFALPDWDIQEEYPKLVSEYIVFDKTGINFETYSLTTGKCTTYKTEAELRNSNDNFSHYDNNWFYLWVRRNVKPLEKEPFVLNVETYREKMDVRLFSMNWYDYNTSAWRSDEAIAGRDRHVCMLDTMEKLMHNKESKLEKAKAVYNYVRNNFKLNKENALPSADVRNVFRSREGNEAQINLVLVAMLNAAGLEAYMLKTGSRHGAAPSARYVMPERLDYTACALVIDSNFILLDASDKNNVFGLLPVYCYNGYARVVSKAGECIALSPNFIEDVNVRSVKITMADDSTQDVAMVYKMGIISSCGLRKELAENKAVIGQYCEKLLADAGAEATLVGSEVENLANPDTNLLIKVNYRMKCAINGNKYYFNPSLLKMMQGNPFNAPGRYLPIEFPYRSSNAFYLNIALPKGFVLDSVPNPSVLSLEDGKVEYRKSYTYLPEINTLTGSSTLKNTVVSFSASEHPYFKAFYEGILQEENKVLEFKKK